MRKASVPGGGTDAFLWGNLCFGDRCNETRGACMMRGGF